MSDIVAAVAALAELPGVTDAVDRAREACTRLRWHEALRRRTPECAAESRVRGAAASAELDGARLPLDVVRDLMRGATPWRVPSDALEEVVRGAAAATAETEHLSGLLRTSPRQALARLHVVAAARLVPADVLGRPRQAGESCDELLGLGAAPTPADAAARLDALVEVLASTTLPGALVAAVAHGEILSARPFVRGNGLVARALERLVLHDSGLDPTRVAVPEAGHLTVGDSSYVTALAAYASGTPAGVVRWVEHCCAAIAAGAAEGQRVADSVLAGRRG